MDLVEQQAEHDRELERFDEALRAELVAKGKCARTRRDGSGKLCRNRAGKGTSHVGKGACFVHGGLAKDGTDKRLRSGIYSTVSDTRLQALLDELENVENPLDVIPELQLARAILIDWTEKYSELRDAVVAWNESRDPLDRPGRVPDITQLQPLLESISRIVYRIERAQSDKYIPRGQFYRVMMAMGRVVDARVHDENIRKQIVEDWLRIEVP